MTNKIEISRELEQFLADVMTAAGLVSEGKQSRKLAERLSTQVATMRAAPVVERQPDAWATLQKGWKDEDRTVITDPVEAEQYNRQCYDLTPLYTSPPAPVSAVLPDACIEHLTAENKRLQRQNEDLSASVKYWFNTKKQSNHQAETACANADNTPYQPKGKWSFERCEDGAIVIRNGKDWTVIKSGDGPIYEQFLYRFCEQQMKELTAPTINENAEFEKWRNTQIDVLIRNGYPEGAEAFRNLGSVQWAGWQARACIDKVKELNQ